MKTAILFNIIAIVLLTSCGQDVSPDGRIVKPFDGEVIFNLPNEELEIFPSRPILTDHGLFVYDKKDGRIKLVDIKQNRVIRAYGGGRGRGPGDYEGFWNMDVHGDTLAIVDTNLFRVTLFDVRTADVISTVPVKRDPDKLFLTSKGFVVNSLGAGSLLYLYSTDVDTAISSESILNLRVRSNYVLSMAGEYTSRDRNREVIYIPAWDSRIFVFEVGNGYIRRSFHFSTFDTATFVPSIVQQAEGTIFRAPNPEFNRIGGVYNNGKLYVPNSSQDRPAKVRRYYYIDIYDQDLKYMHSINMLEERPYPQTMTINNNTMCFMGLENLRCYEMNW